MIPVILSIVAVSCFLFAAIIHRERGEHVLARNCVVAVLFSAGLLAVSLFYAPAGS